MRTTAMTLRSGDVLRMGPTASATVRYVTDSLVLDSTHATRARVTFIGSTASMDVHMLPDTPVDVLRREGRTWTEEQRQWAFDNDIASSRPGGGN